MVNLLLHISCCLSEIEIMHDLVIRWVGRAGYLVYGWNGRVGIRDYKKGKQLHYAMSFLLGNWRFPQIKDTAGLPPSDVNIEEIGVLEVSCPWRTAPSRGRRDNRHTTSFFFGNSWVPQIKVHLLQTTTLHTLKTFDFVIVLEERHREGEGVD